MTKQINLRVDDELLGRITLARGSQSREGWLREAVEDKLRSSESPPEPPNPKPTEPPPPPKPIQTKASKAMTTEQMFPGVDADPEDCKHWRKVVRDRKRICINCGKVF